MYQPVAKHSEASHENFMRWRCRRGHPPSAPRRPTLHPQLHGDCQEPYKLAVGRSVSAAP